MRLKCFATLIMLALSISLVGCTASNVRAEQQNIFVSIRDALVHIGQAKEPGTTELEKWLGSGFLVDDNCTIVTAKHLFRNADKERIFIRFILPKNRRRALARPTKIIYEDSAKDLAYLRAIVPDRSSCSLGNMKALPIVREADDLALFGGQSVFIAGFPRLGPHELDYPILRKGIVASAEMKDSDGVPLLLLDFSGSPGFSGSPVVLERTGEVIGIIFGPGEIKRFQDFEWATAITQVDYEKAIGDSTN